MHRLSYLSSRSNPSTPLVGLLALGAMSAACGADDGSSAEGTIAARFVDTSPGAQALVDSTLVEGLYYGELEIVAYDYRPAQTPQSGSGFSRNNNPVDWSFWVILQSGHDGARDNVLQQGAELDLVALNGDYARPLESEFIDAVGSFAMDFFEVNIHRTGIIYEGAYYGMNADLNGLDKHPLHKYPAWASLPDTYCMPRYPGVQPNAQDVNVIFARDDWFATPVIITMNANTGGADSYTVQGSSRPLSADEQSKIESLVQQGTGRRFYDNLIIVPFAGPIVAKFSADAPAAEVVGPGRIIEAADLAIDVGFNLDDIVDASSDLTIPEILYKADTNNVPFGVTIAFD